MINTKFKKNKLYFFVFSVFLFFYLIFLTAPIPGNALEGDFIWARKSGGTSDDAGNSLAVDSSANVYTVGTFKTTSDFDPGPSTFNLVSVGNNDIFISKLDQNGILVWAKRIGSTGDDTALKMNLDTNGNIYITGYFSNTVDFDPDPVDVFNLVSAGNTDIFILKLDQNGEFVWAQKFGNTSQDKGLSLSLDSFNNVIFTGSFQGTVDFDFDLIDTANLVTTGNTDIFISKLDQDGEFIFARSFGGTGFDSVKDINLDTNNSIYTTGAFQNTVDFDPDLVDIYNLTTAGSEDMFISKLDQNGDFLWAHKIGSTGGESAKSVTTDTFNNVYITAGFSNTIDFDPDPVEVFNLTSFGSDDALVLKLDQNGDFVWVKQLGGLSSEQGETISIDSNNNLYITGYMDGLGDFDPGVGTFNLDILNDHYIFISKLDQDGNFVWAKQVGGSFFDLSKDATLDLQNNLYLTGYFFNTADFDTSEDVFNLTSQGSVDIFILKLGDTTPPVISEITPVGVIVNNGIPSYTFTTNEAGTITYGGSCSSATTSATVGSNIITLNILTPGTYSNCTVTVTDASSNISNILTMSSFDVVVHSGGVGDIPPQTQSIQMTPEIQTTPTPTEPVLLQPEIVTPIVPSIPTEPITPPVVCNQEQVYNVNTEEACIAFMPVIPTPITVEEVIPVTPKSIVIIKEPEIKIAPLPFMPEIEVLDIPDTPVVVSEEKIDVIASSDIKEVEEQKELNSIFKFINIQASNSFNEVKDIFFFYLDKIKEIFNTTEGNVIIKILTTSGLVGGLFVSLASAIFSSPLSFAEIPLIPFRISTLFMSFLGIKKRTRRWGVVYDSITKQPLDPAYVSLKNTAGETVSTAITDIDGRYGFVVEPGTYVLFVNKTNYIFPSTKLTGKRSDELYDNIYFGDYFTIPTSGEVITRNIPLDPLNFSWNEFEKEKRNLTSSFKRKDLLISRIANFFFNVGFVLACIAFIVTPLPYNGIIFALYLFVLIIKKIGIKTKNKGSVVEKSTGLPLSYGIVRVMYSDIGQEVAHSIIDKYGNFYCLIKNGTYTIKIDKKNIDGSYSTLYQQSLVTVNNGVLNNKFEV